MILLVEFINTCQENQLRIIKSQIGLNCASSDNCPFLFLFVNFT
jgi:hypothetical protein